MKTIGQNSFNSCKYKSFFYGKKSEMVISAVIK